MAAMAAVGKAGRREIVSLDINDSPQESWITLRRADGAESRHGGVDLFECLKDLRKALEADGLFLCCQGARPLVFPSGMSRQMSNGRLAYPLRRNPPLSDADLVDIFLPAEPAEVVSVDEQAAAVREFFGFAKKG